MKVVQQNAWLFIVSMVELYAQSIAKFTQSIYHISFPEPNPKPYTSQILIHDLRLHIKSLSKLVLFLVH